MNQTFEDRLQENARRANWVRVCSFLFLMLSTLMVMRLEQSRIESTGGKKGGLGKLQYDWEVGAFLKSDKSLLTAVYLSSTDRVASVFRSHIKDNNDFNTLMSWGFSNYSAIYNPSITDKEFFNLTHVVLSNTTSTPIELSTVDKTIQQNNFSSTTTNILLAVTIDTSRTHHIERYFPYCLKHSPCYVGLAIASPTLCSLNSQRSPSWSCLNHTLLINETVQCIRIVSGPSMSHLYIHDHESIFSDTMSIFCGNPVPHLLAVDSDKGEIFFIQDYSNRGLTTLSSYEQSNNCFPIIIPQHIVIDLTRPPIYIHFDIGTRNLILFHFDVSNSLFMTAIGPIPTMSIRFSVRLEGFSSGWLLVSNDPSQRALLLFGDRQPYAGILHTIDLDTAQDIRFAVDKPHVQLRGTSRHV